MERIYLCLDVGGTEIKAAPVGTDGCLLRPLRHFPAKAKEAKETLLENFSAIFSALRMEGRETAGLRLAFPGPFDYARGICLLRGLDKYDALYGINLRAAFASLTHTAPQDILFTNDASAFALGEMRFGPAQGARRALFVCIGTGCGSAFGADGALAPEDTPGVPPSGYLYPVPFLNGRIDDYISRRGLLSLAQTHMGTAAHGLDVREISLRAQDGDAGAIQCFSAFGENLCAALLPFLGSFQPETVCLGGQITQSAALFAAPLKAACHARGIRLYTAQDTSVSTLRGLSALAPHGV